MKAGKSQIMTYTGVFLSGDLDAAVDEVAKTWEHRLPCGQQVTMAHVREKVDISCPCGDPTHWLVRVQE